MDGFSIRTTLRRQRPWPGVVAVGLLLAGALPLLWPWSVRSRHQQTVLEERTVAVEQARSELQRAEEAVAQAVNPPHVVHMWNERPERFDLVELRVYARELAPPPFPAEKLEFARWCDQWDGPGRTCERGEESLTKAEAAIMVAAHEHGALPITDMMPILVPWKGTAEEEAEKAARRSLADAEREQRAPIPPPAGATGRWAGALLLLVACGIAAFRTWRFHPGVVIEVDQHRVRYGDTHVPVGEILTCVARDHVLLIGTAEDSLVWGPFAVERRELEKVADHIREVMLTPQQRAAEERAKREVEMWHGALEERSRD